MEAAAAAKAKAASGKGSGSGGSSSSSSSGVTVLERDLMLGQRDTRSVWMIPPAFAKWVYKEIGVEADVQKSLAKYHEYLAGVKK